MPLRSLIAVRAVQERRKDMSKTVSKLSEDGKVAIRNVRRDAMKQAGKLEKEGSISEDGLADLETAIQELTDEYVKQVRSLDGPQHVGSLKAMVSDASSWHVLHAFC